MQLGGRSSKCEGCGRVMSGKKLKTAGLSLMSGDPFDGGVADFDPPARETVHLLYPSQPISAGTVVMSSSLLAPGRCVCSRSLHRMSHSSQCRVC